MNDKTDLINKLQEICSELGWAIAIDSDNDNVQGLIIGEEEFINYLLENLNVDANFDIFVKDKKEDPQIH